MKRALFFGVFVSALAGYVGARMVEGIMVEEFAVAVPVSEAKLKAKSEKFRPAKQASMKKSNKVSRIEAIETLLRQKKKIDIRALRGIFPDISERTLRRDMEKLEKQGIAKQKGHTKDTSYILVS